MCLSVLSVLSLRAGDLLLPGSMSTTASRSHLSLRPLHHSHFKISPLLTTQTTPALTLSSLLSLIPTHSHSHPEPSFLRDRISPRPSSLITPLHRLPFPQHSVLVFPTLTPPHISHPLVSSSPSSWPTLSRSDSHTWPFHLLTSLLHRS